MQITLFWHYVDYIVLAFEGHHYFQKVDQRLEGRVWGGNHGPSDGMMEMTPSYFPKSLTPSINNDDPIMSCMQIRLFSFL